MRKVLETARHDHKAVVKERIEHISKLSDVVDVTKGLYDTAKVCHDGSYVLQRFLLLWLVMNLQIPFIIFVANELGHCQVGSWSIWAKATSSIFEWCQEHVGSMGSIWSRRAWSSTTKIGGNCTLENWSQLGWPKSGTCGGNILPFPVHHATTVLL